MSGRTTGFEIVLVIDDRSELADFERLGGGANVEGGIRVNPRGEGDRGGHNSSTMQNQGGLSIQKAGFSVW